MGHATTQKLWPKANAQLGAGAGTLVNIHPRASGYSHYQRSC